MGMLMGFYAGDANQIGKGFSSGSRVPLWKQPFVQATADFSLHLSPIDLDLLSEEAYRLVGMQPVTLTDSLTDHVGGDGESSSADVVASQWVATFAQIPNQRVEELAKNWFVEVGKEHNEPPEQPTADALRAINDLIHLCQIAKERNLSVVHTWSL
jgi:hypothetical protein